LRVHGGCQGEQAALALAEATVQLRDPPRERNRVWQLDFSEFETTRGGIWRICSVIGCALRSPQTNGVVERFFGTLKYEHLYRAIIGDGNALAVEVNCFRHTYNTPRPHQALGDRTLRQTYLTHLGATSHRAGRCS
jgi:transposase InsO family protein